MADDDAQEAGGAEGGGKKAVRHFDMRDIERAEKAARKKEKKKKKKRKDNSKPQIEGDAHDDFQVDASDPRFAGRLFENHEFAIDPSNPRYKETTAMKELLDEGRRRKKDKSLRKGEKREKGANLEHEMGDNDVQALVEKLKKRDGE